MTIESAPESRRGFLGSLPQTLRLWVLCWQPVFLLSVTIFYFGAVSLLGMAHSVLAFCGDLIVGLFIRLHTEETLDFQKQKRRIIKKSPFLR